MIGLAAVLAVVVAVVALSASRDVPPTVPTAPPARPPPTTTRPTPPPSPSATGTVGSPNGGPVATELAMPDPADDVADPEGFPPPDPVAAADLVRVEVDVTATDLHVEWHTAGPVPPSAASLLWSLELRVDGEPAYSVNVQLVGARLFGAVFDWSTNAQVQLPEDSFGAAGATVSATAPLEVLPRLGPELDWTALTQLDGGYEDRLDGDG